MLRFKCKCGKTIKAPAEYAGKKVKCPSCDATLRLPSATGDSAPAEARPKPATQKKRKKAAGAAASKSSKPTSGQRPAQRRKIAAAHANEFDDPLDGLDDLDLDDGSEWGGDDDDWGEDFELPGAKKKSARKKSAAKSKGTTGKTKSTSEPADDELPRGVWIAIFSVSTIVFGLIAFFGVRYMMNSREAAAIASGPPTTFETLLHEDGRFEVDYPSGWIKSLGGGTSGVPPFARFENEDQTHKFSIKGSMSGAAIGDIAGATNMGESEIDELAPVHAVHVFQGEKIALEYDSYEETPIEVIQTGLGEGRICEFTASKTFSKSYGLRATLLTTQFQFNVICTCPKNDLDAYRPIFRKLINGIRYPGTGD